MELNEFFTTVILTAAVFAALVTSIANIIISLMNNWRLKKIEKQKQMNEIDKYRYSRLYELILNWHKYDSAQRGDTAEEIAFYRLPAMKKSSRNLAMSREPIICKHLLPVV